VSQLHIQLITGEQEFAALAVQWQALAAQDEQAGIFNDWQWNSLWWQHYKHLGELYVLLVYSDERLVGLAPLYRNDSKAMRFFRQNTLRFIGTGGDTSPDDVNIVASSEHRAQVVDAVWDHLLKAGFDRMIFVDLPAQSSFHETGLIRAGNAAGYVAAVKTQARRCADLPGDWAGFRQQISRNTHKRIKRRQNRLDTAGDVRFKICNSSEDVDIAFAALVKLHAKRWQAKGQGGAFSTDAYLGFHRKLMDELLAKEQLWLITLALDNEIIGVEYAFMYKHTLLFFQTGFDPEQEHLSPGHVLMTHAIQCAIESGVKRIDLLKGDYDYKSSYANQELDSASWTYYSTGLVSVLARIKDKIRP